ncbi:sialate O-acetylesterase [Maridesulfovibrio sp.]|uniref:sialate O-acetylesterase n=1 Tax=Maridesulfovibrio sp. TaxID=2795000 RepID=UPI003BA886EC
MKKQNYIIFLLFMLILASPHQAAASQPDWLPARYSDNMVIPKGKEVPFAFECKGKKKATIIFKGETYQTTLKNGWFIGIIPKQNSYGGPFEITFTADDSSQTIKNVWVGEVLFFSGQSNMEFPCKNLKPKLAVLPKTQKHISFFNVQTQGEQSKWVTPNATNIPELSALAYLSAIELSQNMNIPLGVITSAVGGSRIEEWLAPEFENHKDLLHPQSLDHINKGQKAKLLYTTNSTFLNKYIYDLSFISADANAEEAYADLVQHQRIVEKKFPTIRYLFKITKSKNKFRVSSRCTSKMGIPYIRSTNTFERTRNYPFNILVWYQGEANANDLKDAQSYRFLLDNFIKGTQLSNKDYTPVLLIQLPEYIIPENHQNTWAYIREAQANTAASNPNVRLVPALGTGNKDNVHPPDKRELARRVAAQLEQTLTNKPSVTPQLSNVVPINGTLRLIFTNTYKGLKSSDSIISGFSITDSSGKEILVKAKLINKRTVDIALPVPPKEVRYAWGNYPKFSLYNSKNIPVPAFRLIAQ